MRRFFVTSLSVICLVFSPSPAVATNVTVQAPPELNWALVSGALSDGRLDAGDLLDVGFQSLWSAISNMMSDVEICQDANTALRDSGRGGRAEFGVTTTILPAGGGPGVTFSQRHMVRAVGNQIAVAPIIGIHPDGTIIIGKVRFCGRASGTTPEPDADDDDDNTPDRRGRGGADIFGFETAFGHVSVYLPSDLAAGDTISGTVLAEPAGSTPEERQANAARLNGHVIDVNGARVRVGDRVVRTVLAGGATYISLSDGVDIVSATPLQIPPAAQPVTQFDLPDLGQAGQLAPVAGPFDGDLGNTVATLGDQICPILAESPRQAVVLPPAGATGPLDLRVGDGERSAQGRFRSIGVRLSAGATTLTRGERTQLSVELAGLQGLEIPLLLRLQASDSVRLQGGNSQSINVPARAGDAQGVWRRSLGLQAIASGGFEVTANVGPR